MLSSCAIMSQTLAVVQGEVALGDCTLGVDRGSVQGWA